MYSKNFNITREFLVQKYHNEQLSRDQIAQIVGCAKSTVFYYMKKYDIERRSQKDANILTGSRPELRKLTSERMKSRTVSDETRKKISEHAKTRTGQKNPNWKLPEDRRCNLMTAIRECDKSKTWKKQIIERDNYKCVKCECNGGNFDIDHIIPMAFIVRKNKITSIEEARNCEELWDLSNGRTLCHECHKKTETYCTGSLKYIKENLHT